MGLFDCFKKLDNDHHLDSSVWQCIGAQQSNKELYSDSTEQDNQQLGCFDSRLFPPFNYGDANNNKAPVLLPKRHGMNPLLNEERDQ